MGDADLSVADVVAELEPTPEQKSKAMRSWHFLCEQIEEGRLGARVVDRFLSGSYPRDTAIQPLDDVDIVYVIQPSTWKKGFLASYPHPEVVLRTFERAIRYRYEHSGIRLQRVSVRLQMNHLDIDVVPAIADEDDPELLRIPDRYDEKWVLTSPEKHTRHATEVNKRQGGLFKPLVKLLKGWNAGLPNSAWMKNFAVETMAVRIFSEVDFLTLTEGLMKFWDFLAWHGGGPSLYAWKGSFGIGLKNWTPAVPDVAKTGSNTLGVRTRDECSRFVTYAIRSRDCLGAAIRARTQQRTDELTRKALRLG